MKQLYEADINKLRGITKVGKFSITGSNIPKINKVPNSLMNWSRQFDKIDPKILLNIMSKFYDKQYNTTLDTCIEFGKVHADDLKKCHNYITENITKDDYAAILKDHTEDYQLFRSGIIGTYMFMTLYSMYIKSKLLMTLCYDSYAIYIYSILFRKWFPNCKAETFQSALQNVHKLNLMNKFKESGHISVIDHVVFGKIKIMIDDMNANKFNKVTFSRSYSYIKSTFNQTFNKFANNAYYPYINREDSDSDSVDSTGINSSEVSIILMEILGAHDAIRSLPPGYATYFTKQVKFLNEDSVRNFLEDHVKLNTSETYKTFLENIYKQMLLNFPIEGTESLCTQQYVSNLLDSINKKVNSKSVIKLRTAIDEMNAKVIKGVDKQRFDTLKIKATYRKIYIVYLFQIYVRHTVCR